MANFKNGVSIAYADTYFSACKKLPGNVLRDEINFREKFTMDPTSRGLNYEKLFTHDPSLRSARVNGSYRAIVKTPGKESKNVYTLLWIDSHDEAYAWAEKKRISVNPVTNAVEIYNVIEKEEIPPISYYNEKMLFQDIANQDLITLGINEDLFWLIRTIPNVEEFEKLKSFLPNQTFEFLFFLLEGIPVEEIIEMSSCESTAKSFEEAVLSKENSKQFYIVDSDEKAMELNKIMEGPLVEWRIFLHPQQLKIATSKFNGPAKILGGAGTGKTVVAMHRAKWLAEQQGPDEKVLFTTFTANLADDIESNLNELCLNKIAAKIEVINLDKWVHQFHANYGKGEKVIYGEDVENLWKRALKEVNPDNTKSIDFYQTEYERVVLANEINNFDEYRSVRRVGRGISLNRKQKFEVWQVIDQFKNLSHSMNVMDGSTLLTVVKNLIDKEGITFPYRSVIVDEAQDFGDCAFRLIRTIAGVEHENDVFIVGDANQRIYGKKVVLKNCGLNTVGRTGTLKINYRTTEEIRKFAYSIIADLKTDDLDDGIDDSKGYISVTHGIDPVIQNFNTKSEEFEVILQNINRWKSEGITLDSICIMTRLRKQLDPLKDFLGKNGIASYEIKPNKKDERTLSGVRIATMHRVKGLEFDCVVIADVNQGLVPLETLIKSASDNLQQKEIEESERLLLYVAATRAKKELLVFSYGTPSNFLMNE